MKLTIREAATLLGRSPRTLRHQVTRGEIAAVKKGGRWLIPSETLPLTEGQRRALQAKASTIRGAVEEALPSRNAQTRGDRGRSLADLAAFRSARAVLHQMRSPSDAGASGLGDAERELGDALLRLAEANFLYDRSAKLKALGEARLHLGRAVGHLLMEHDDELPAPVAQWVATLENETGPQLAGLARWTESLPGAKT